MNLVLAAIDRADVADYLRALFTVYLIFIFIRILLSWIPRLPYNPVLHAIVTFVHDVTDPYLRLFRRIIPPVGGGGFGLDISPIIAIIVLYIVEAIVVGAVDPG
jgi:YggT family protein